MDITPLTPLDWTENSEEEGVINVKIQNADGTEEDVEGVIMENNEGGKDASDHDKEEGSAGMHLNCLSYQARSWGKYNICL